MEHIRLTVDLRPGHGTLARLAATLNNHHVLSLAYRTAPANGARAVVHVPRPDAVRAQQRLRRLVDVIDVTSDPVVGGETGAADDCHPRQLVEAAGP